MSEAETIVLQEDIIRNLVNITQSLFTVLEMLLPDIPSEEHKEMVESFLFRNKPTVERISADYIE